MRHAIGGVEHGRVFMGGARFLVLLLPLKDVRRVLQGQLGVYRLVESRRLESAKVLETAGLDHLVQNERRQLDVLIAAL